MRTIGAGVEKEVGVAIQREILEVRQLRLEDHPCRIDTGTSGGGAQSRLRFGAGREQPQRGVRYGRENGHPVGVDLRRDLVAVVETREDAAVGGQSQRWAWRRRADLSRRVRRLEAVRKPHDGLAEVGARGSRDDHAVREQVIDEGRTGGAGISQPVDLDGCRPEREEFGHGPAAVAAKVDEHVDAERDDAMRHGDRVVARQLLEVPAGARDAGAQGAAVVAAGRKSDDLDRPRAQALDQLDHEQCGRVVVEPGRDEADADRSGAPDRARCWRAPAQRFDRGDPARRPGLGASALLGAGGRFGEERERGDAGRPFGDEALERDGQRVDPVPVAEAALQEHALRQRAGKRRVERERSGEGPFGFGMATRVRQRVAEIRMGHGPFRTQAKGIGEGDRRVAMPSECGEGIAADEVGPGIARRALGNPRRGLERTARVPGVECGRCQGEERGIRVGAGRERHPGGLDRGRRVARRLQGMGEGEVGGAVVRRDGDCAPRRLDRIRRLAAREIEPRQDLPRRTMGVVGRERVADMAQRGGEVAAIERG